MGVEVKSNIKDVCEKGDQLLQELLTPELLSVYAGKVVAIDVDTKEMAFGANFVECRKQLATNAGERIYATRVGDKVLHRFGSAKREHSS